MMCEPTPAVSQGEGSTKSAGGMLGNVDNMTPGDLTEMKATAESVRSQLRHSTVRQAIVLQ